MVGRRHHAACGPDTSNSDGTGTSGGQRAGFIHMHNESSVASVSGREQQRGKSLDRLISANTCDIGGSRSVWKYAVLGMYGNGFAFLSASLRAIIAGGCHGISKETANVQQFEICYGSHSPQGKGQLRAKLSLGSFETESTACLPSLYKFCKFPNDFLFYA